MDNLVEEQIEALPLEDNPQAEPSEEVYTKEQRERHLQQLEGSKKEAERKESLLVETYVDLASQDASQLDRLYEKDPKLADKVAQRFEYDSYEDLKRTLSPSEKKGLTEEDFERMYKERKAKEEDETARQKAEKLLWKLEWEAKEKAQSYFDMITEWKRLTTEKATEFAEMATLYVNKDKFQAGAKEDIIDLMASSGISWKKATKPKAEWYYIDPLTWKLTLDSND